MKKEIVFVHMNNACFMEKMDKRNNLKSSPIVYGVLYFYPILNAYQEKKNKIDNFVLYYFNT